jgi:flagellar protein FliO/FliZ
VPVDTFSLRSQVSLFLKWLCCFFLVLGYPLIVTAAETNSNESLQMPGQDFFTPAYLGQLFAGLIVVIGLILVLAFLFRKLSDSGEGIPGNMKVLAGLAVGTRERLVLVQVGKQQLLVGVAPGSVNAIAAFDEPVVDPKITSVPALNRLRGVLSGSMQRETA